MAIDLLMMVAGGVISSLFAWFLWTARKRHDYVDQLRQELEELEDRVNKVEQSVHTLTILTENQQEIKQDVKEIHSVVNDLRVAFAAIGG